MREWVLSVCGVALLAFIAEIVLPDGATKKYCNSVLAVVVTFSMLLPVVRFVGKDFQFENSGNSGLVQMQTNAQSLLENNLEMLLERQELPVEEVQIDVENCVVFLHFDVGAESKAIEKASGIACAYLPNYKVQIVNFGSNSRNNGEFH